EGVHDGKGGGAHLFQRARVRSRQPPVRVEFNAGVVPPLHADARVAFALRHLGSNADPDLLTAALHGESDRAFAVMTDVIGRRRSALHLAPVDRANDIIFAQTGAGRWTVARDRADGGEARIKW